MSPEIPPNTQTPKKSPPNPQISVTFGGLGVWGTFFGGGVRYPIYVLTMAKEGHAAGSQQTAKEVPISESVLALAYLYFYIWYTIYIYT